MRGRDADGGHVMCEVVDCELKMCCSRACVAWERSKQRCGQRGWVGHTYTNRLTKVLGFFHWCLWVITEKDLCAVLCCAAACAVLCCQVCRELVSKPCRCGRTAKQVGGVCWVISQCGCLCGTAGPCLVRPLDRHLQHTSLGAHFVDS